MDHHDNKPADDYYSANNNHSMADNNDPTKNNDPTDNNVAKNALHKVYFACDDTGYGVDLSDHYSTANDNPRRMAQRFEHESVGHFQKPNFPVSDHTHTNCWMDNPSAFYHFPHYHLESRPSGYQKQ